MKTLTKTFDGTGTDTWTIPGGNFLQVLDTSGPIGIKFFKGGSSVDEDAIDVEAGFKSRPVRPADGGDAFDSVQITSATAQTVKIAISRGEGGYDHGTVSVSDAVDISKASTLALWSNAGANASLASATQLQMPAWTGRRTLIIRNLRSNTNTLMVGTSIVDADCGMPVYPGESLTLETTADVYLFNSNDTGDGTAIVFASLATAD